MTTVKKLEFTLEEFLWKKWQNNHKRCMQCKYRGRSGDRVACDYSLITGKTRMHQDRMNTIDSYANSENCSFFEKGKREKRTEPTRAMHVDEFGRLMEGIGYGRRAVRKVPVDASGENGKAGDHHAAVHAPRRTAGSRPRPGDGFDRIRDPGGLLLQAPDVVRDAKAKTGTRRPIMMINSDFVIEALFDNQRAAARAIGADQHSVAVRLRKKVVSEFRGTTKGHSFRYLDEYLKWKEETIPRSAALTATFTQGGQGDGEENG